MGGGAPPSVDKCVGEGPCHATRCRKIRNKVKKVPLTPSFLFSGGVRAYWALMGLEVGSAKCINVNVEEGHKLGVRHVGSLGHVVI